MKDPLESIALQAIIVGVAVLPCDKWNQSHSQNAYFGLTGLFRRTKRQSGIIQIHYQHCAHKPCVNSNPCVLV